MLKFVSKATDSLDGSKFKRAFACCGIAEKGKTVEEGNLNHGLQDLLKRGAEADDLTQGVRTEDHAGYGLDEEEASDEEGELVIEERGSDSDTDTLSDDL